jgi:hypothetical protein
MLPKCALRLFGFYTNQPIHVKWGELQLDYASSHGWGHNAPTTCDTKIIMNPCKGEFNPRLLPTHKIILAWILLCFNVLVCQCLIATHKTRFFILFFYFLIIF